MRILIFLNIFKINLKHKKKFFKILYTKQLNKLIALFITLNLIKYTKIINNNIYIWPNLTKKNINLRNYKVLYKLSNKQTITIKSLKKLREINYNKLLIISTSRGYLTVNEAIRFNLGGFLFLKFI